ncbi:MAG: hypothetical protein CMK64_05000 [Pseudoalteromonas sp.]|nr:hypothetical protein [Pseudoalteromonas sp.]|tara:strand:- start:9843 stop:10235 length:393 start_codon:yes stop_codon:yes gene_type:complete
MELTIFQIVYYGSTKGIVSDITDETVSIHLEDGRYVIGVMKMNIFNNDAWTVMPEKAVFGELGDYLKKAETIKNLYSIEYSKEGRARCFDTILADSTKDVEYLLGSTVKLLDIRLSRSQILKPLIAKGTL